ncbi:hypothetical protein HYD53_02770 [Mycoplasmopsis bovis]|nr:hypothetical protein [Mycoplasmopsis bovis]QQH72105.1 hypothetical protein HYD53_02770 [Mycoplasmopsis bovis]
MINHSTYTSLENVKKCFYDENKFLFANKKNKLLMIQLKYALNKELLLIKENKSLYNSNI